jgi:hypothetical protein
MLTVVRQAIEHLVGAELAAVLGPPYARGEARVGYRHGSKVRTITSPVGAVTLTVPRARLQVGARAAPEWQSQVLPAYARRMRQVNAAVLQAYLCGANTRRIRGALKPLLQGRALSKSAICRIVQGLKAQLEAWRARTLADLDLVALYLDGFHLRVRLGGRVSPVPVLAVLGVQRSGQKVLVHLSLRGSESTAAWAFRSARRRGGHWDQPRSPGPSHRQAIDKPSVCGQLSPGLQGAEQSPAGAARPAACHGGDRAHSLWAAAHWTGDVRQDRGSEHAGGHHSAHWFGPHDPRPDQVDRLRRPGGLQRLDLDG